MIFVYRIGRVMRGIGVVLLSMGIILAAVGAYSGNNDPKTAAFVLMVCCLPFWVLHYILTGESPWDGVGGTG